MGQKHKSPKKYGEDFDINLFDCEFLGEGNNGVVYLMPDGRVIKICKEQKSCDKEYFILKAVNGNRYFPKVYECNGNYMIREYVGGECLKDYIKSHGLSRNLVVKLVHLVEEFRKLKFTKLDIRCRDIFIQANGSLLVIDPKSSYTRNVSFPRHMMKGLRNLGVLNEFLQVVKEHRPNLYTQWMEKLMLQQWYEPE